MVSSFDLELGSPRTHACMHTQRQGLYSAGRSIARRGEAIFNQRSTFVEAAIEDEQ